MRIIDPVSQRIIDIFRQPLGLPRTANINPRIDARFKTCKIVTCGKPLDAHSPKNYYGCESTVHEYYSQNCLTNKSRIATTLRSKKFRTSGVAILRKFGKKE